MKEIFLLSCQTIDNGGGIYKYRIIDGIFKKEDYYPCNMPMYAVSDKNVLHIILRNPFGGEESGYFTINSDFTDCSYLRGTNGKCACHIAVNENDNYIVNYLSGNLVKNCELTVLHTGIGYNCVRQEAPHTHCVGLSKDSLYVLCADLGLDTIFCYDKEFNLNSEAKVPLGYGVRHFVFSNDGKIVYAVNELMPSVSVFTFVNGKIEYLSTEILNVKKGGATGAAIRLSENGKWLYVSVREENAIYVFETDNEKILLRQKVDCGGIGPRDFNLVDDYLIVCNEKSNNAVLFKTQNGLIKSKIREIEINNVLCCVVKK